MKLSISDMEKETICKAVEKRLSESKESSRLLNKLRQTMLLCRLFNKKAEITFETEKKEMKTIIAKVWLTTCNKVVLKEGTSIPTQSIRAVKVL